MTSPSSLRDLWSLDPFTTYLNHGSFGPSPRVVQAARAKFTARLESQPMDFFLRELPPLLDEVRRQLGEFLHAPAADLTLIDNATFAMNVVAESFALSPGDEVLLNDHEYGAVMRIWERACRRSGASMVQATIGVPISSPEEIVEQIFRSATARTRLIVVSHITSPTAIIFPVEAVCREARRRGIAVCIDGPHAPGMIHVDLTKLDCDFYAASCHKWLAAPFGSGFLYVHPRRQAAIEPIALSWGRAPNYRPKEWCDEFLWAGTRDPAPFLAIPRAIDFLASVGWQAFREETHALAGYARQRLTDWAGNGVLTPDSADWYGAMVAVPIAPGECQPLQDALWSEHRIEVPIVPWNGRRLVRISCHLYNDREEIDRLMAALEKLVVSA